VILANLMLDGRLVDVEVGSGVIRDVRDAGAQRAGEVRSFDGRAVVPGLWDEHVHLAQWAMSRRRIDVEPARSAAEAVAIVAAAMRDGDEPVVGHGYRDALWPDEPTASALDSLAPHRPVVLVNADLHSCWLNTAALARFGLGGTGIVRESAAFALVRELDAVADEALDGWIADAAAAAAARGVVGVVDLEMRWGVDDWVRRVEAGFSSLRVETGIYPQYVDLAIERGLRSGDEIAPLVRVGPAKIISDGSLGTRTAYCHAPYPDGGRGLLTVPAERLIEWMSRCAAAGLSPAVHAIGDAAAAHALDAFAAVGCGGRIEHAQLLTSSDVPRFAELGVTASVQPEHAMDDRDMVERFWADSAGVAFPLRGLLDSGARLVFGSDAPVAALDPWRAMSAAVVRGRDGREPWRPGQSITPGEALTASSRTTIAAGEPADLVVVDADPRSPAALRDMPVHLTMLGGEVTFAGG
jgi:predicted amidohydrolase YtcJ